ncbi:MAG: hypothetical protein HND58_07175 [Planctomycetota bacterium]|nr:MAG: hypothetical protein HND58_07175 [Planctomycetota bacterium]
MGIAHQIARAIEDAGVDGLDIAAVAKRAQHVGFGINAEDEFAVVASWLGCCDLVHPLGQPGTSSCGSLSEFTVPDLLICSTRDKQYRFCVEVKTSSEMVLPLRPDYRESLLAYARLVGIPVLIAWKCRRLNWWTLFDPATVVDEAHELTFEDAAKRDLMGPLLGEFHIELRPNDAIRIDFELQELVRTKAGAETWKAKIKDFDIEDSHGQRLGFVPALFATLLAAPLERQTDREGSVLVDRWVLPEAAAMHASRILAMQANWGVDQDEAVRWKALWTDRRGLVPARTIDEELGSRFGSFTRYILRVNPSIRPIQKGLDIPDTAPKG